MVHPRRNEPRISCVQGRRVNHYTTGDSTVVMDEIDKAISYYITKITRSHYSTVSLVTLRIN